MNSFFGIGIMELFFIAVIAMLVLGPERLPAAIREVAKYIRMIRGLSSDLTSQFSEELKMLDEINPQKLLNEFTAPLKDESTTKKPRPSPNRQPLQNRLPNPNQ
ncbi:MAG: twin-arginine translocase subunit TatB [Caldilineaceae bacterium]|nr:twin-arginine translocase subunit TatB [Caldilineaceae bacterium]